MLSARFTAHDPKVTFRQDGSASRRGVARSRTRTADHPGYRCMMRRATGARTKPRRVFAPSENSW
jgi:hypothetical protein